MVRDWLDIVCDTFNEEGGGRKTRGRLHTAGSTMPSSITVKPPGLIVVATQALAATSVCERGREKERESDREPWLPLGTKEKLLVQCQLVTHIMQTLDRLFDVLRAL